MSVAILMGILLELLKKNSTAKQLSEKFEVSKRTIYRYVESLCQSGVPIVSCLGKNGGFGISSAMQISNLFFTTQEIDEMLLCCKNQSITQKLELAKKRFESEHSKTS